MTVAEREEALYRQAHHDDLTGLPNRQLLKDRLEQQIMQARRESTTGAVLYLDLDRFNEVAKPSSNEPVQYFSNPDPTLFQSLLERYAPGPHH